MKIIVYTGKNQEKEDSGWEKKLVQEVSSGVLCKGNSIGCAVHQQTVSTGKQWVLAFISTLKKRTNWAKSQCFLSFPSHLFSPKAGPDVLFWIHPKQSKVLLPSGRCDCLVTEGTALSEGSHQCSSTCFITRPVQRAESEQMGGNTWVRDSTSDSSRDLQHDYAARSTNNPFLFVLKFVIRDKNRGNAKRHQISG